MRIQVSKFNKYYLPRHELLEVYHHALQYNDWKHELNSMPVLSAVVLDGMPHNLSQSSPTENLSLHRLSIESRIKRIEDTVREADQEIYKWLLDSVTNEKKTFEVLNPPCSRTTFYERKRKFYWLLAKKLHMGYK